MAPAHITLGLLTLAAFEIHGVHSWPLWLQVPFISAPVRANEDSAEAAKPEALLLGQLKSVDAMREPEKAHALNVAVANILRADGNWNPEAIQHLEAARDAALHSTDANSILSTRLALAQAYLELGRPKDANKELESEPQTNTLLSPDNFWEFSVKLDHVGGRTSFELGDIQLAAETFEDAAQIANQPEDIVHLTCDLAMAQACLGRAQRSVQPLHNALEVLEKAYKAEIITATAHRSLAMQVHTRLAEALHSMGDIASAKRRYEIASSLEPRTNSLKVQGSSAIKASISSLEHGRGPLLRCPGGTHTQRFQLPARGNGGKAFEVTISALLKAHEYRKAEYELWNHLETQKRPYKSVEATTTLISLGNLYLLPEKRSFFKAAQCFMKALPASLSCCGPQSQEAKAAFQGLSHVQDVISPKDRAKSAAVMQEYLDAAEESASANDLGRHIGGLKTQPSVISV